MFVSCTKGGMQTTSNKSCSVEKYDAMSPAFPSKTPAGGLARNGFVFDLFSKREGREED